MNLKPQNQRKSNSDPVKWLLTSVWAASKILTHSLTHTPFTSNVNHSKAVQQFCFNIFYVWATTPTRLSFSLSLHSPSLFHSSTHECSSKVFLYNYCFTFNSPLLFPSFFPIKMLLFFSNFTLYLILICNTNVILKNKEEN